MVGDHALVAAGDEDEVLDSGLARLVHDVLQRRPVDDGQHLLRHRLGGGEESGAEAGDGEDGLSEPDLPHVRPFDCLILSNLLPSAIKGPIEAADAGLSV